MSHKLYKNRYSSESDDGSKSDHRHNDYKQEYYNDQCRACIVCPPSDYREKYESESSERSCLDFYELCEDKPRICCEKKILCQEQKKRNMNDFDSYDESNQYHNKKLKNNVCRGCEKECSSCNGSISCGCEECSDYSRSSPVSSLNSEHTKCHDNKHKKDQCRGCDKRCSSCNACKSCGCKECSDYSRSSVASSLGSSEPHNCRDFDFLACDQKKKCCKLEDPCKKECYKPADICRGEHIERKKCLGSSDESYSYQKLFDEDKKCWIASKTSGSSSSKGKKFIVSFGPKEGHPWAEYNGGTKSIHINGKNGPVLHLYRGCTYFFCVEQNIHDGEDPFHSFVLTNSPVGGHNSRIIPNGFAPVSKGCVCFKVDKCTPRYFFYQDSKSEFKGGLVIVHDAQ